MNLCMWNDRVGAGGIHDIDVHPSRKHLCVVSLSSFLLASLHPHLVKSEFGELNALWFSTSRFFVRFT